jgi:hypothetical protein
MAEITGDEIRQGISFCNAYGPAADEVRLKSAGLQQAVKSHRHDIGQRALRAYRVARNFHTPQEEQQLVPHIENMKRLLARGPKKKAPKGDATAAAKGGQTATSGQTAPSGQNVPSGQTVPNKA